MPNCRNAHFCALLIGASALALAAATPVARANDSIAELATGGLVLGRSAYIELRSEDLYVSAKEIRVSYRFFSHGAQDQKVTVAFPMSDITVSGPDSNISAPSEDPENFLDFSTKADGRPVVTHVEQKVFAKRRRPHIGASQARRAAAAAREGDDRGLGSGVARPMGPAQCLGHYRHRGVR